MTGVQTCALPIFYRVELSGKMIKDTTRIFAQKRKYLSGGIDISDTLRKFARMCALDVIDLWDAPKIVIEYLKTGNEDIREKAYYAADAVVAASYNSVYYAATAATHAADDADADADDIAYDVVTYASYSLEKIKINQNRRLTRMVNKAIEGGKK